MRFPFRRFIDRALTKQTKAPGRNRVRIHAELLEDRLSPATLIVNSLLDNTTTSASSTLTLREAILLVNSGGSSSSSLGLGRALDAGEQAQVTGTFGVNDSIAFSAGLADGSNVSFPQRMNLTSALPPIITPTGLTINGANGASAYTIDGGSTSNTTGDRIFFFGLTNDTPLAITGASNTNPIVITASTTAGMTNGQSVTISNVGGNTAANGTFIITVLSSNTFSLNGSDGTSSGVFTTGGGVTNPTGSGTLFTIQNIVLQNGNARGGTGGNGKAGGGGGAGLGGALFVNAGTVTAQNVTVNFNKAVGGNGGSGSPSAFAGGGGGGGIGGSGGSNSLTGSTSGGGGGGGFGLTATGANGTTATSNNGAVGTFLGGARALDTFGGSGALNGGGGAGSASNSTRGGNGGINGSFGGGGGGGGGSSSATRPGVAGGFGGGGGGHGNGGANGATGGGAGGFGGGGGGGQGAAGFGGGNGGSTASPGSGGGGGGGLGAGGGVYVRQGASLNIIGGSFSGNTVTAGSAGGSGAALATAGTANGQAIFLAGSAKYTISSGTTTLLDSIGGGTNSQITGGFTKSGSGTLVLAGGNSYTGGTIVNGGSLVEDFTLVGTSKTDNPTQYLASQPLTLAGSSFTLIARSVSSDVTNSVAWTGATTSPVLQFTGGLPPGIVVGQAVSGTGIQTNAYIVSIDSVNFRITLNSLATATSGTFNATGGPTGKTTQTFTGLTINAGASAVTLNQNSSFASLLTLGALTRAVGGTLDYTNPSGALSAINGINTSTGTINLIMSDSGVAYSTVGGSDWAALSSGNIIAGLSTVNGYTATTSGSLAGNADVASGVDTTLGGTTSITSLRFNVNQARTITATGQTLTAGGILVTSAVATAGSQITGGALQGPSGKDLVVIQNSAQPFTIGSTIADNITATGLTKSGSGVLTLTQNENYTGATNVNAGTLQLAGNSLTANSAVTIAPAGTLEGTGTVNGTVAVNGTLGAGVGGTGTLTLTNGVTFGATGTLKIEINGSSAGASSNGYDQVSVTAGAIAFAGGVSVTVGNGYSPSGSFVILQAPGTSGGSSGTFSSLAEGATVTATTGEQFTITYLGGDGNDVALSPLSAAPTVSANTAARAANATTLIIAGTNFSSTPGNNTVVFSSGAGTVTAATSTSLTVTFSTPPSLGSLTATVSTPNGTSSAVQVATIVAAPVVTAATTPFALVNQSYVTITGSGFSTTPSQNAIVINGGAVTGTVVSATATTLIVTFTGTQPAAGAITAVVSVFGGDSGAATQFGVMTTPTSIVSFEMNSTSLPGGTDNFGPSPYAAFSLSNTLVSSTGLVRGSGVTTTGASGASHGWGGINWQAASGAAGITANQFFTFGATVASGASVNLSAIDLSYRRSGTGPANALWQYQLNGGAYVTISDVVGAFPSTSSSGAAIAQVNLSGIAALQNLTPGTAVNFRVVPYAGTGSAGTFYVYDTDTVVTGNDLVVRALATTTAPTVTVNTATLTLPATQLIINGSGFSTTPSENTVAFNLGVAGTVSAATATSLTVDITAQPTTAGSLTAVVTTNGVNSGSPLQVATVIGPAVTQTTGSIPQNATQVTITGTNFSTNPGDNTVSFNLGAVGTVTAATATTLTVTLSTPPNAGGALNAVVTTLGLNSGAAVEVAFVVAAPTVTQNTADRAINAATITIAGTGFSGTPANNTVTFNLGAVGTVTASTTTSLTVTFSTPPSGTGTLTAIVSAAGGPSAAPVQVANIVGSPTVTANSATLSYGVTTLTIAGTNFSTTPANNSVSFNLGAIGAVTAATATQLTITFSTPPTSAGTLTAVVTSNGGSSGTATTVATAVIPANVLTWEMTGLTNYGPSPYAAATTTGVANSLGLTRGSGVVVTGSAAPDGWGGTNWSTTNFTDGISASQFATFGLTVAPATSLSLVAIDLNYRRSSTGPANGYWQYQIGNAGSWTLLGDFANQFSSTASGGAAMTELSLSGVSALQNLPANTVVNFRLTPYGATGTAGSFYIYNRTGDDAVVKGFSNPAAPVVVSISPSSGPAAGGTTVIIAGSDFTLASAVKFGAASATNFTVNSATQITATAPAGSGVVDVTVITSGGASTASAADQYTYLANAAPTITSNGGGATANLSVPENSTAVTTVVATDIDTPPQTITYSKSGPDQALFTINPTTGVLTFLVAPDFENPQDQGTDNVYNVTVTATDNGSPPASASQDLAITVTDVATTTAAAESGNDLTIASHLSSGNGDLTIANTTVSGVKGLLVTDSSGGEIHSALAGVTGNDSPQLFIPFTSLTGYQAGAFLGDLFVNMGAGDDILTLDGGATGSGNPTVSVRVNLGTGQSLIEARNSFVSPSDDTTTNVAARVEKFHVRQEFGPQQPIRSNDFLISGGSTGGGTGTLSSVEVANGGTLAPGASPGLLSTFDLAFASGSTYAVELNGATPGSGYDQVAVNGTVTLNTAATLTVSLGYTPVNGQQFKIIDNDDTIDPVVGHFNGLTEGTAFTAGGHRFSISYQGGDGNDVVLTVVDPQVTSVTTAFGPLAGRTVTIGGVNFTGVSGAAGVQFGAGNNATSYTVDSATQITAVAPAGSAGTVDVIVTNGGIASNNNGTTDDFTYVAAPTVTSVAPFVGPTSGGTTVIITGAGFKSGATDLVVGGAGVTFGAANAATYVVNSATQITATAPVGSSTVEVVVTSYGGSSSTAGTANDYTFAQPAITSVVVNGGAIVARNNYGGTPALAGSQSVVEQLLVTFNQRVTLEANAFNIASLAASVTASVAIPSAAAVAITATGVAGTGDGVNGYTDYVLTFNAGDSVNSYNTGSPLQGNTFTTLKDGFWQLNTIGSRVHAGGDTAADRADKFWSLYGAVNSQDVTASSPLGDGNDKLLVDGIALGEMYATFGSFANVAGPPSYNVAYDYNLDGIVDGIDLGKMYANFGAIWTF